MKLIDTYMLKRQLSNKQRFINDEIAIAYSIEYCLQQYITAMYVLGKVKVYL